MLVAAVSAAAFGAEAGPGLSCEQVFAVAQASVRYRDQGHTLDQVLSALKDVEVQNRLAAQEIDLLRKAVSVTYMGQATPEEVALECVQARGKS